MDAAIEAMDGVTEVLAPDTFGNRGLAYGTAVVVERNGSAG